MTIRIVNCLMSPINASGVYVDPRSLQNTQKELWNDQLVMKK